MERLDYNTVLNTAIDISKKAGKKIMEIYNNVDIDISFKDDNSPLTEADKASNAVIEKELKKLTPSIPILSEEGKDIKFRTRQKWNLFWLIDPLDGTKEFIKRNGEFTVNIALISDGEPILGIVFAPVLDTIWYGDIKKGSFKSKKNKKPFKIKTAKPQKDSIIKVVTSRSHTNNPKLKEFLMDYPKHELVKMGSSIKICCVADGTAHIYPRLGPTMEWDTAAAHAVVKFAGGNIYDLEKMNQLKYNKSSLLNPEFLVNHT